MTDPAELPEIDHEALAAIFAEPLPTLPAADWPELPTVDWVGLAAALPPVPAADWEVIEAEAARLAGRSRDAGARRAAPSR